MNALIRTIALGTAGALFAWLWGALLYAFEVVYG